MSKDKNTSLVSAVPFNIALEERYLAYALSTIMSRSLPDVRDGLKPVHRRILYAMYKLKIMPNSGFKKSARVVGDVIGKYHPHGDSAVYDTLVRLAQSFSIKYPLIDGQGNFGSIDGDNPAAMRYTEARLTVIALELLQDIDKDTVDFRDNYDGSEREPVVFPACFPNVLANGSEGIAVGMATSIPPHNLTEIMDALLYFIKNKEATTRELVQFIKAPDFPTGGIIAESAESIITTYEKGRGSFRLRAKWRKEELSRNGYRIVIYEIPYQIQKSRLLEKLADLLKEKKIPSLGDIDDESDDKIRIIIEPKSRNDDPIMLMEQLFRLSDLEIKYNLNMNILDKNALPQVMQLNQILKLFLEHRIEVLIRASKFRLEKIIYRLEVLDGLLVAYLNLDEVINVIREEDEPKMVMIKRWMLTENQAEAILNIRLRFLHKLEEEKINAEKSDLTIEKEGLEAVLASESKQLSYITKQIKNFKKQYCKDDLRQTEIEYNLTIHNNISATDFVVKENITLIITEKEWFKVSKGQQFDREKAVYKKGDNAKFIVECTSKDKILLFTDQGKFFTVDIHKIINNKNFESINFLIEKSADSKIIEAFIYKENQEILVVSTQAKGFVTNANNLIASTKQGKQIMQTDKNIRAFAARSLLSENNMIAILGQNRRLVIFKIDEISKMQKGKGVTLQKYASKECNISDFIMFSHEKGMPYRKGKSTIYVTNLVYWLGRRAGRGATPPYGFPRNNKFI